MPSIAKDDLAELNMATMTRCFGVNAFGPFFLTQALLPNILAAPSPRRICVTSSRVGSITDNGSGRYYSYRASKTAVNSFFKNFAVELKDKDVIVSMLHPGFTKSNLDPDDVSFLIRLCNTTARREWSRIGLGTDPFRSSPNSQHHSLQHCLQSCALEIWTWTEANFR